MDNPVTEHFDVLKMIIGYVKQFPDYGIRVRKGEEWEEIMVGEPMIQVGLIGKRTGDHQEDMW